MSRRIDDLHPVVAGLCRRFISLSKARGINLVVTCTLRTEAEQLALFAQGRKPVSEVNILRKDAGLAPIKEKENRVVTRALASVHQFGCAFDVAIILSLSGLTGQSSLPDSPIKSGNDRKITWDIKADLNENDIPDYEEIGAIGESLGLRWGGRFTFRDYCHFEYTGGLTLAELKAGKRPDGGFYEFS